MINLETLGTDEPIGFVPEEGFQLRRYQPSRLLVEIVDEVSRQTSGQGLVAVALEAVVARVDREPSVVLRRETRLQRAGAEEEAP